MRTIKIRGYNHKHRQWLYGDHLKNHGKHYIIEDDIQAIAKWSDNEVVEESIGQYTGVLDKNGTPIYEGDIVSIEDYGELGVIVFSEGAFQVNNKYQEKMILIVCIPEKLEVTGNIYDKQTFEPCCGNCLHFSNEDAEGIGYCNRMKMPRICGETCKNHQAK